MAKNIQLPDEVVDDFILLLERGREMRFEVGDRLIELVKRNVGRRVDIINYLAGKLQVSGKALYDYYRIAERWKPEYRDMYPTLEWTIVRNSDPIRDKELLDKCVGEGWTYGRFMDERFPSRITQEHVLSRVYAILKRNMDRFDGEWQKKVQAILEMIEPIL